MRAIIKPGKAKGKIKAPPSKSMAHRLLIAAGLAEGDSVISGIDFSDDITATAGVLKVVGADLRVEGSRVFVRGIGGRSGVAGIGARDGSRIRIKADTDLDVRESGSTLRFFIPIMLAGGYPVRFVGAKSLFSRPLDVYERICREQGIVFKKDETSLTLDGRLKASRFKVPGNISSQFITGLMYALPLLGDDSALEVIPPIESGAYIDMTVDTLSRFGIRVIRTYPAGGQMTIDPNLSRFDIRAIRTYGGEGSRGLKDRGFSGSEGEPAGQAGDVPRGLMSGSDFKRCEDGLEGRICEISGGSEGRICEIPDGRKGQIYKIPGGQRYIAADATVEGDYSNAAYLDVLTRLGGDVTVEGLNEDSLQGDKIYREYFGLFDDENARGDDSPVIDISGCPDLGPVLIALAAAKGGGVLTGTERLGIKECDRGRAMAEELAKFGIRVCVWKDKIKICRGKLSTPSEPLSGHNDHRIVMALSALCTITGGVIEGCMAVKKSFPGYFDAIRSLGIDVEIQE